jgi:D-glycero-D-manno-heptose 1,7-bisphosphate phosphatase
MKKSGLTTKRHSPPGRFGGSHQPTPSPNFSSIGSRKAVFLDRDGVINQARVRNGKPYPPQSQDELKIIEGIPESLQTLKEAGYLLIGITNQPDVARGKQRREIVESIHKALLSLLPLDEILTCYHDDADECFCRKPKPGLILKAARHYQIDLSSSFMIGDRWRDIEAGNRAGCSTILIDYHYQESGTCSPPNHRVSDFTEAVKIILADKGDLF